MSGGKTTYYVEALLDAVFLGQPMPTPPATWYLVLSTQAYDPNATGDSVVEVSDPAYARIALGNDSGHWVLTPGPSAGLAAGNIYTVASEPFASEVTVVSGYLGDAESGGSLWMGGDFINPVVVSAGDPFSAAPGELAFTEQ